MATERKQQQERELTSKESAICLAMIIAMVVLVDIEEGTQWHWVEWLRVALALVLGIGTCAWQYKRMTSKKAGK